MTAPANTHRQAVRQALRGLLAAAVAALPAGPTPRPPVQAEGDEEFVRPAGQPYVSERTGFGSSRAVTPGTKPRMEQLGTYLVDVFVPKGDGTRPADALADALARGFVPGTERTVACTDGARTVRITEASPGDARDPKTGWWHVPVTVTWATEWWNPL